ncbi:auxin efflux carrier [Clohesyomyces aquaticus]|uniref:Auxin efflux carrier n=1 Tax=Clohesyomyces aquaticus TaxID=1231657 RepID=A0A1Y1YF60_9PLEO|nr:auxin efflux carrier [Clohesyomyces aquaticus]
MSSSSLLSSFEAAIQASLSVLLVIGYGGVAARLSLLDNKNGKALSKICVKMFLPALLVIKIGSELHPGSAHRYLIILLWAFFCHFISFLIGIASHLWLGFPDWITAAIMFNNTTSYPLLLVQSLDQTGVLKQLIGKGETSGEAIERAKSYFLVFATVSSCLTFAVGPRLIDTEHAPDSDSEDQKSLTEEEDGENHDRGEASGYGAANEETGLLAPPGLSARHRNASIASLTFFPSKPKFTTAPYDRRPTYIPRPKWRDLSPRAQWWLLFLYDFLNAPLIGAVIGAVIGLTPPLHRAFFNDTYEGGIFTAWLTESWRNVGQLFVPLPLIVAGISLYTSYQDSKRAGSEDTAANPPLPWLTTTFILVLRFIFWPVLSIGAIYWVVKEEGKGGILGDDPMLWFAMMLMPTGPPAMKLITMIQVSDAGIEDERRVAKLLTVSYIISPLLAFTVVGALRASHAAL